jgi:hypothetical protein
MLTADQRPSLAARPVSRVLRAPVEFNSGKSTLGKILGRTLVLKGVRTWSHRFCSRPGCELLGSRISPELGFTCYIIPGQRDRRGSNIVSLPPPKRTRTGRLVRCSRGGQPRPRSIVCSTQEHCSCTAPARFFRLGPPHRRVARRPGPRSSHRRALKRSCWDRPR